VHVPTALGAHDRGGSAEEFGTDGEPISGAVVRVDDELERPAVVTPRELRVPDRMVMAVLPRDKARESLPTALYEIEPLMFTEWTVAVRRCGHIE